MLDVIIIGVVMYLLSVFTSIVFYGTDFKHSIKEIIVLGVFFTIMFAIASWVLLELSKNSTNFYPLFLSVPIFFTIFSSYDYLIVPIILYFFRKKNQTNDYDSFLNEAKIKAKVIKIKNLDNAYSMGLLRGVYTILIGDKLINRMTSSQISGIILHEIAHIKKGHLWTLWLINLFSCYLLFALFIVISIYYPDNLIIRLLSFGLLGAALPFLNFPMKYFEKHADIFAAQYVGKEEYIATLKILYGEKKDTWSLDHPKLSQRIKYIEKRCL